MSEGDRDDTLAKALAGLGGGERALADAAAALHELKAALVGLAGRVADLERRAERE